MTTHSSILIWESHGQRSPVGYSPRGCKESDTAEHRLTAEEGWLRSPNCASLFLASVAFHWNLFPPSYFSSSFSTCHRHLFCEADLVSPQDHDLVVKLTGKHYNKRRFDFFPEYFSLSMLLLEEGQSCSIPPTYLLLSSFIYSVVGP